MLHYVVHNRFEQFTYWAIKQTGEETDWHRHVLIQKCELLLSKFRHSYCNILSLNCVWKNWKQRATNPFLRKDQENKTARASNAGKGHFFIFLGGPFLRSFERRRGIEQNGLLSTAAAAAAAELTWQNGNSFERLLRNRRRGSNSFASRRSG